MTTLERRVWYPHLGAYLLRGSTPWMGLAGVLCFAFFLPAWLVGAWLPHPVIGAFVAYEAWRRARRSWEALRWTEVEVYPEGLRVFEADAVHELRYDEVHQLYVSRDGAECRGLRLSRDWPGYREVLQHLVRRSGLVPLRHGFAARTVAYQRVA